MTASSIVVPTTTSSELATDLVADRHFQYVKLAGGGEGVTNELAVDSSGRLSAPRRELGVFASAHPRAGGFAYDAGDVYGDPSHDGPYVCATYLIRKITAIDFGGNALPDGLKLLLIPHSTGLSPAYGDDGDPFAATDAGAVYLSVFDLNPIAFGAGSFALFEPAVDVFFPGIPVQAGGGIDDPADEFTLSTYLIAPEGAPDTGANSVGVTIYAEQVGPLPSTSLFDA